MPETLREKATKTLQDPDANPSQLGDPTSLKAEQSNHMPTEDERGATQTSQSASPSSSSSGKSKSHESLRERAVKKLYGPEANPSMLGDPTSLKAETSDTMPTDDEAGAHGKDSKL
ncbi:uncharacterized protein GGS25DRAFT_452736 [Hypoxylon fragiforme]|uniref:uncharacterized protein n=1 Tax=Hypoxylon fragiforme TaxID=63214 RepID=UPI0020C6DA14|nr:uncharacterized protein GGS25DRAFT_452736 [Hypoxylon fragiforme]KAI2604230.1 hypothetical protein GGS25DRAFT_452736 [Hypoxylon fragiforme]